MAKRKIKVRVKIRGFTIVSDALGSAVVSAMNKTDKWCEPQLTDAQRHALETQVANYFWLALEEAGTEIV